FLSFHSPDRQCALTLKAAIEQAQPGSEVFVDQAGLRYGHLWQPALFDAIAKSTAFIILVSNQLGDWQKVEYYEARDRKAKDDDYLLLPIDQARRWPELQPLHELRATLSGLRLTGLEVGSDGRNRCLLSPFKAGTSRNQPSNTKFIFGPARWMRGLIKPPEGCGLAYIDFASQEIG